MPSDLRVLVLHHEHRPALTAPAGIRSLSTEDRDDLAVLYLHSYPPDVGAADLDAATAEIDATLTGDYGALRPDASFMAVRDGDPAGAILVTERSIWDPERAGPFVIDLFVTPAARGRGVATALVTATARACRATGDATLSLRVGTGTSAAAHAIYATLGFVDPGQ